MFEYIKERVAVVGHFRVAYGTAEVNGAEIVNSQLSELLLDLSCGTFRQTFAGVVTDNDSEVIAAYSCGYTAEIGVLVHLFLEYLGESTEYLVTV